MFAGVINQAKAAVTRLVLQYVARASVAVPFLVALGFALAAITLMLVQRYGHTAAYWMMAGGLVAIGIIAAIAVGMKEREEEVAEGAEQAEGSGVFDGATAQAALQAPLALLGAASAVPGGATTILKTVRALGRHYPVVLLVGLIGLLFWPTRNPGANALTEAEQKSDAFQPAQTWH